MKKLLITQKLKTEDRNTITSRLQSYYDLIFPDDYSEEELLKYVPTADVCLGTGLTDVMADHAKDSMIFQSIGTGVDRLNLPKLKAKGITVCNSHSHSIYVAEFALSLLFSLTKRVHHHDRLMREGKWWRPQGAEDDFFYLSDTIVGKKVGFLGFGHIGQNIAKMLKGFGVSISAYDIGRKKVVEDGADVAYLTRKEVIENSDIIFITLPLTDETKDSVGSEEFKAARKSSLWIHISRGPVICERDLYDALIARDIGGIAIDNWFGPPVVQGEKKYPSTLPFHECKNVLLSSYRAIYVNGMSPHLDDAVANLVGYATAGELKNTVNFAQGF